ncbi:efflux RND transporter periplasmic adaptor subunit [Marinilabilia sp.]|uniref:efflux RND transporter periplasmic adaptor subunit n=1 Tax=Marinilabilia sp. TaxID=2021252 RepID=UPI0025BD9269|nr:efflux RND transporter periplasmic adaptor subunit [Marinilabilia sp.]
METKIFIALLALATLMSCNSNNKDSKETDEHVGEENTEGVVMLNELQREALDLELGDFQMRNLTTLVKTNGQLEVPPAACADVTAIIGGNVKEIKVFHGDKVTKGQALVMLEHPDYIVLQEEFAETANKLEFLEQEYARQKELFENNVGAGKDFQQVKSEFNTAKARYEGLKSRLQLLNLSPDNVKDGNISNTISILSPINGFVNEVNIKLGTYVDAKDRLLSITDNREIHADFMVYENDVHLLEEGQKVDFSVSNRPGEELSATVFAIGKEFEANTRAVHIHASLDKNPGNLIPGMYVSGHIHTDENRTRTLPNDAVVTEGTKSYIFVVDDSIEEETHEGNGHEHEAENEEEHDHESEEKQNEHAGETGHEAEEGGHVMAFRRVEVITGMQESGYTEIKLLNSLPDNTQIVLNAAYYLLADMNKEETEHKH